MNQSRSENSLSASVDVDELRMLANRKISAPDCTDDASLVSGKYRTDSGFLSVEENFAKKKKYSEGGQPPPPPPQPATQNALVSARMLVGYLRLWT
jgi:hypothetical protein